jgi:drug/metabolite transporter (DMT)-like permease
VAVLALSFAAIFFRKAAPTHPLVASGIRLAVACGVLLPFLLRAVGRRSLHRRVAAWACAAGLFYAIHFGAWVTSLGLTTVAASVTLVTSTPLLLAVAAVLTGRDRPSGRLWIAIALSLAGVSTIGGFDFTLSPEALAGDALALLGAAAMAGYLLIGRRLGDEMDLFAFSAIATGVGALVLIASAALFGLPLSPASSEALLYLVLAALVPQLVGHMLLTWALRHTTPTVVGLSTVGEPVGATLLGWLWLGETVPPLVLAGCGVTLTAVVLTLARRS